MLELQLLTVLVHLSLWPYTALFPHVSPSVTYVKRDIVWPKPEEADKPDSHCHYQKNKYKVQSCSYS